MGNTEKEPEAIADAQSEVEIGLVPDGPGKWKFNIVASEGLEIRPGDVISIDNVLLGELIIRNPDGTPIPVKFDAVVPHKIGTDDEGFDIMSAYLDPKKEAAGFGRPRPTKPKNQSHASSAFEEAASKALEQFGENQPLNGNGPQTRVVPLAKVRDVFNQHYKPEGRSDNPQDAIRSAFNRARKDAHKKDTIAEGRWNDTDWVWQPE